MRTRVQVDPDSYETFNQVTYEQFNGGTRVAGPNPTTARTIRLSYGSGTIIDDPGTSRGIKSVSHTKVKGTVNATNSSSYGGSSALNVYSGRGAVWVDWYAELGGSPLFERNRTGYPLVVSYVRPEANAIADAVHDFYSANETDNLLNAIESPQLISSLQSLRAVVGSDAVRSNILASLTVKGAGGYAPGSPGAKAQVAKGLKSLARNLARRGLGSFGKRVSGLYLAYSFGIAPLVSDIRKVDRALANVRQAIRAAKASAGKLVSIHRKSHGTISYRNATTGVDYGSSYVDGFTKWSLLGSPCIRTVTVRGYRSQKFNSSVLSQLDYLLSRFGATGPASLGWELIPFSFVLDWFVDLRNITDRLDNLLTGSTKRILDVCVSEKYDAQSVCTWFHTNSTSYHDVGTLLCQESQQYYRRDPVIDYNYIGPSGRFGKKQASLLGALIHQHVANLLVKR